MTENFRRIVITLDFNSLRLLNWTKTVHFESDTLAALVQELEMGLKPLNTELIQKLTDKLKTYIHA